MLWNLVVEYGNYVRSNHLNSKDAWKQISYLFPSDPEKYDFQWNPKTFSFLSDLSHLLSFDERMEIFAGIDSGLQEWKPLQLLLQHARIVKLNPSPSLLDLMYIAFFSGQFSFERGNCDFSDDILRYYDNNKLNDLSTYVYASWHTQFIVSDGLLDSLSSWLNHTYRNSS